MNKWAELLIGLILLTGMILIGYYSSVMEWTILGKSLNLWHSAWEFLKGGIFWLVIMVGLLLIMLGISDLKS